MGDQHDQATRLVRLGVGLRLDPRRFTLRCATRQISVLLRQQSFGANAARVADAMRCEHGPDAAADAIASALDAYRSQSQDLVG